MTNDERREIVKRLYIIEDALKRVEMNVQALVAYVNSTEQEQVNRSESGTSKDKYLKIY